VDTTRDLGRVDPWQESLERSLARRRQLADSKDRARTAKRRSNVRRRHALVVIAAASLTLGVAVASLTGRQDHRGDALALAHANVDGFRTPEGSSFTSPTPVRPGTALQRVEQTTECHPVAPPASTIRYTGYVNPLAAAHLTAERIDQGVDYAGTGSLAAVGPAKVTRVADAASGWPGAFIAYRLLGGPDRGCTVYYAEGVRPAAGLRVGETVAAGRRIATLIPGWSTGIEIGWGAGVENKTYATLKGQWNAADDADSVPTASGKSFSALIAALGGPPGKIEG
jgi:hypothetical protein